ncbi:malonyl-CoA decarboxylase, mitochondrial isoform X4 [Manihot esculenta]|uniref:malonyl-CoA decarboxylase, mitochondrial isoform X4 n=1 Tax=Manihot esculenta TaxID=3983 RepID=UPI001CC6B73E|nr:malonyl-CoA decarboxylase, mitochondrial isoform X4 [Manihot esculenta]
MKNKKGLAILMRTRMKTSTDPSRLPLLPLTGKVNQMLTDAKGNAFDTSVPQAAAEEAQGPTKLNPPADSTSYRDFDAVRESMHSAISLNKAEVLDVVLDDFSEGYFSLSFENRRKLLITLAQVYDLNRAQVRDLIKQYLGLELPGGNASESSTVDEEAMLSCFYRVERNLRQVLKPAYEVLFERLNNRPGGLKFLSIFRADVLSILAEENIASLRALDSYLKEKLNTWLSPAALELHQITWDDPASLLEKIVAYEAVHPISNLLDLKRRLGVGRRCFGYLHPAIRGEPLIFIEVALLRNVAQTIQEVLWDTPPIPESEATCALFYSISSTQESTWESFLSNVSLNWLKERCPIYLESFPGKSGMDVMLKLLTSTKFEWISSPELLSALKPPLMRLCARYLLEEKKRGKALDSVANFHLQNGAMIERINWMADRSEKGLRQSGGIMVNYIYRVERIDECAHSYFSTGHIHASNDIRRYTLVIYSHKDQKITLPCSN